MSTKFQSAFLSLRCDNPKSKIQNPKWAGLSVIAFVLVVAAGVAQAQQPAKIPHIGFLFFGSDDQPYLESFRQGLKELGYVEGRNIAIEYRYAEGKSNMLPALAAQLVSLNLDVILTTIPRASRAVLQATNTIPIVVVGAGDPVRDGLAKSLAQPGGNLTGLSSNAAPGMAGKLLELLKDAFPKVRVVALLWNSVAGQAARAALEEAKAAAKTLGLRIRSYDIKSTGDIEHAFEDLKKSPANALLVPAGQISTVNSRRIVELATQLRLPAMYNSRQFVTDGGLMAYGVNFADLYRRAATYVDKILKGRKPNDLPIEQPINYEFVVNLKAAAQIGVTIPPNVLARADKVIR
jgi:putative ABC transport system substrate-binding protein